MFVLCTFTGNCNLIILKLERMLCLKFHIQKRIRFPLLVYNIQLYKFNLIENVMNPCVIIRTIGGHI